MKKKRAHFFLSVLSLNINCQASGLVHELEMLYVLPGFSAYTGCWLLFFSGWGVVRRVFRFSCFFFFFFFFFFFLRSGNFEDETLFSSSLTFKTFFF